MKRNNKILILKLIKLQRIFVISFVSGFVIIACEDKFYPDIDPKYENILVVDGMITNAPGPYTVKLMSSLQLTEVEATPLTGFQIIICDDSGNTETLSEPEPGIYVTDANGIQGIPGRSYQLKIQSPNGNSYQSDFELLNDPVAIDSLYPVLEFKQDPNLIHDLSGYQFYVDTEPSEIDSVYFFWRLTHTYQYQADFIIRWIYDGTLRPYTNSDSLRTCWNTQRVKDIFTFNTGGLMESSLHKFPLHYVSTETRHLSIRYSLLVDQMTINKTAYEYWHSIDEQNTEAGELYTKQPYQIRGNLYNTNNPDELVLGYFMVAGTTSRRIFVDKPDPPVTMYYPLCQLTEADYMNFGTLWLSKESEWPIFATFDVNGGNALPNQECLDCRLSDGTIVKPYFWEDNN